MAISLATQFVPYVDELFTKESRSYLLTNKDFSWTGAHTIKVYKISTADMTDYGRNGAAPGNWSRYGTVQGLDATTQEMTLRRDRSFTFALDKLDIDETKQQLQAAAALARQLREVAIPEVDRWVYAQMCENAGHQPTPIALTGDNIYTEITRANNTLDNSEVPEIGRVLLVTPDTFTLLKQSGSVIMATEIGQDMRIRGVVAMLDGAVVVKVPANRLPDGFGFMIAHPVATVAPVKLEDYIVHADPPGINGSLIEGRINYDAFVLDNKAVALYYQRQV